MSLADQLQADLTVAIKGKQEPERTLLRSLTAAIKNAEIAAGKPLDDAALTTVLTKQVKQRVEAAEAASGRPELAEREQAEAAIIKKYLPEPLSDEELTQLVDVAVKEAGASGPAEIGKVMGVLKAKTAGRADQGNVAKLVKERLTA